MIKRFHEGRDKKNVDESETTAATSSDEGVCVRIYNRNKLEIYCVPYSVFGELFFWQRYLPK